jgi:hypothetical protein
MRSDYQQQADFSLHQLTRIFLLAFTLPLAFALAGCAEKPPVAPAPAESAAPTGAEVPAETAAPLTPTATTWTPEALEELLAPIALYPEVVLGQALAAATNPQEVLDAGNWLLQNQELKGKPLDEAAKAIGFTAPVRVLLQWPEVIDMLCLQIDWTTELGQAFVNDQVGVLEAVQRLRAQAQDVGNLASSDKMTVETVQQDGNDVITINPPASQVVYVPQYNPVAVYAPPPAVATSTTVVTEEKGYSTGAMVTTGLLAFGGGLLVANIFDDDDDDYYPNYYGSPPPYYPPPYRPRYGNGYYPSNGYRRPPGYNSGFNNNTVIINNGNNNDYWKRYDSNSGNNRYARKAESPITAARSNRPELNSLNTRANDQPKRAAAAQSDAWKGQKSYAGAKSGAAGGLTATQPKLQGSYAGGKAANARPAANSVPPGGQRPAAKPASSTARSGAADRGRPAAAPSRNSQPTVPARAPEQRRPSALSGANRSGSSDRAASQRGRQSMPKGVPPKARGSDRSKGSGARGGRGR